MSQSDTLTTDTTLTKTVDSTKLVIDTTKLIKKPVVRRKDTVDLGIDSTSVYFFRGSLDSLKTRKLRNIDSSTLYFHQYDPLFKYNGVYSTLSNIGLAHKNLSFSPPQSIGYYFQNQSYPKYIYENQGVKYYKQYIPYTEVEYVLASKKEQNFSIIFSRELWERLSIGFDFVLNNSPGPYKNSKADDKRVFFTAQYYTKNARYGVVANYLWNKLLMQENGGIKYDSVFEDGLESDRRLVPVNLNNANSTVKQSGFYVEQYFNFLKPTSDTVPRKIDAGNLSWSFHYQRNQMFYSDNEGIIDFYIGHATPIDSVITYDSVYQERIRNRIRWSSIGYHDDPDSQLFHIYFGITLDNYRQTLPTYPDTNIQLTDLKTTFSQLMPFGGISLNISKIFKLRGYAEYIIGNYNTNDFKVSARLDQILGSRSRNIGSIHAGLDLIARTPSWYFSKYNSNFYRWSNDLQKESYLIIFGEYRFRKIAAGVKFYTFSNYTYFDDSMSVKQTEQPATALKIYFSGTIPLKKFGINTRLVYQTTSQPEIVRFPNLLGTLNIYFKSPLFKRAATVQTGFQLNYFSEFEANAYMPAVRDFYLQETKKIGNYIYADVYVTLQIKTARLFFKYAHFNSLLGNYNYYLAPHYPARDARFVLGINWRFHD